jgi:hypothetical protein
MMLSISKRLSILITLGFCNAAAAQSISLDLPIECEIGETCFTQQFVDHDTSKGVIDFSCGGATYDGHRGTDFRVRNLEVMRQGVNIIAAAPGRVNAVRDGMSDKLVRTDQDRADIKGKECGNGLIVQHENGWVTQYCHMKKGSVARKQGEMVEAGDVLGQVGLSGKTQFPHLHITVRKDNKVIDPFDPEYIPQRCSAINSDTLWSAKSGLQAAQQPTQIFDIGFGNSATTLPELEDGVFSGFDLTKNSVALVGYVRVMNLEKGDRVQATLSGPKGVIAEKIQDPFDRRKAQTMMFIGKKKPKRGWTKGTYRFAVSVLRNNKIIERESREIERN